MSLAHNFGWMLRGNLFFAACQWGMVIALAKFGSPEMLGRFSLALAIAAPVFMFSNLNLRAVQATDAKGEYAFREYFELRLATTFVALSAVALLGFLQGLTFQTALVIIAVGLAKAIDSISDVYFGLLQQHERMDRIAKSAAIRGLLGLGLFWSGIYWTENIFWAAAGLVAASLTVLLLYDRRSGRVVSSDLFVRHPLVFGLSNRAAGKRIARLAWLALPLGFVMSLLSLNINLPRYFIESELGERELGIFSALAYIIGASHTITEALGQSASPRLANYWKSADLKSFRKVTTQIVGFGLLLGGGGLAVATTYGEQVLTLLYSPQYAARADIFRLLMLAATLLYVSSFLGYAVTAARYFRVQMPLFLITTGITALGCATLIPRFGLRGAGLALILSATTQCAGMAFILAYALHRARVEQLEAIRTL